MDATNDNPVKNAGEKKSATFFVNIGPDFLEEVSMKKVYCFGRQGCRAFLNITLSLLHVQFNAYLVVIGLQIG